MTGRSLLVWAGLVFLVAVPLVVSAMSPLLAWRDPVYILAGLSGVTGLALLLCQPLLARGFLPGLSFAQSRRLHHLAGIALVLVVVVHVVGLWVTSPPDVIDALTFNSPTPFSAWGVIAMWAVFVSAVVAALRRSARLSPRLWRVGHRLFALVIVACTVVHTLLIDGTMEAVSKWVLCAAVSVATVVVVSRA